MCPRLDSHNSRHNTTKNLWNLNREKSHEKFSFGKRLRRKKNEIKNRKCSYENIWWWLIIIIVILLSTSARCWSRCSGLIQTSFFFRRLAVVFLRHFFRVVVYTFQWVRWNQSFSQHVLLTRVLQLPIQQKNLSVFYTPHLSASSFTGFRCSHIDVDDDDDEHVNLQ